MNRAVREVESSQRGEARESLEPRIGHSIISIALAMIGIVAVVKVDCSRYIENFNPGARGREVKPLRTTRRTDDGLAADVLNLGLQRQRTAAEARPPLRN